MGNVWLCCRVVALMAKSLPICPFRWTTCYGYAEKKKNKPKPMCAWWLDAYNCCAIARIGMMVKVKG